MKKIALVLAVTAMILPSLAAADSLIPTQPTVLQLMTRVAALEAQEAAIDATSSVACAATTNLQSVSAGQPFILAWGSVGALAPSASSTQSMWTQNGAESVTQQTPGIWQYPFTFYGVGGGSATCAATIKVTS